MTRDAEFLQLCTGNLDLRRDAGRGRQRQNCARHRDLPDVLARLGCTSRAASACDLVTVAANSMRSRTPGPILGFWAVTNSPNVCQVS